MSIRKIKRKLLTFILRKKGILAPDENVMLYLTTKSVQKLRCEVGFGTYCGDNVVVGSRQTKIGKFCSLASNIIIGPGEHPLNYLSSSPFFYMEDLGFRKGVSETFIKPCEIGNDAWIGSNVFIRSGVKIGDGAVIGAGAVVTKDVPPYAVAVGVPAKILKYRFDEKTIEELLELKWWELDNKVIKTLPFKDIPLCIEKIKEIRNEMHVQKLTKTTGGGSLLQIFFKLCKRIQTILENSGFMRRFKLYEKIKHGFYLNFKPVVISRSVCLGTWAFDRIETKDFQVVNYGKNRVDYALDMHNDKSRRADAFEISKYTPREYRSFRGWYWAEERDLFKHKKVKAFVMDSFSELVDQRFVSKKNGRSFCTIYRAVKGTKLCDLYDCLGLLDIDLIKKYYLAFFKELRKVYQDIPVVFLHFSTVFETRENFIARAAQIEKAIDEINREENMGIIQIKPRIIEHHETDPNAYHYSKNTYDDVAVQLADVLNNKGVFVKLKNIA